MAIRVSVCVLVSLFLFYFSSCQINFVSVCVLFCFLLSFARKEGFYGD